MNIKIEDFRRIAGMAFIGIAASRKMQNKWGGFSKDSLDEIKDLIDKLYSEMD